MPTCPHCKKDIADKYYAIHQRICFQATAAKAPVVTVIEREEQTPVVDTKKQDGVLPVAPDIKSVTVPTVGADGYEIFYPVSDPCFIVSDKNAEALDITDKVSRRHPTNLLITGHPGCGKTSLAIQFAAKYNRPIVIADFGILQEPQQLFQTTRLIQGKGDSMVTDVQETGFVKGLETKNCVVVADEINRVENERVLNPLMPILDGRKSCWVDELRRRIHVADGVVFMATINEGALFCGINSVDAALRDRFREIFIDYLPAEQEAEVIMKKSGVPEVIAKTLAQFSFVVRNTPTIDKKISTRQLLHAAESFAEGTSLWQAIETAVGNYNDLSWRQQVMEIFSLNIMDDTENRKWQNRGNEVKYAKY